MQANSRSVHCQSCKFKQASRNHVGNCKVSHVILVKSLYSHGNRWKQAAATNNNNNNNNNSIDVDKSEDFVVVPVGFVYDVAEMLGNLSLINAPAAHTPYPAPSHQLSHMVPRPVLVELVNVNVSTVPLVPFLSSSKQAVAIENRCVICCI